MSGSSYKGTTRAVSNYESLRSADKEVRLDAHRVHREVVSKARVEIAEGRAVAPPKVQRNEREVYDPKLASNVLTVPEPGGTRAYLILVDNSGSNSSTAEHIKTSSGYLCANAQILVPNIRFGMMYCSDHGDGPRHIQYVNFVKPDEAGDKRLFSSLTNVFPASGRDLPESIECWLKDAANVQFGDIPKEMRTLVLVTDSWAHDGIPSEELSELSRKYSANFRDDGCPAQVSWRASMRAVREHYGSFVLIGSGNNPDIANWQRKLFENEQQMIDDVDAALNFIDLSTIPKQEHRNAIVGNALLFIMARDDSAQTMELFLSSLYAKWLLNPIFGGDTTERAEKQIRNFSKYLAGIMSPAEIDALMTRVFAK